MDWSPKLNTLQLQQNVQRAQEMVECVQTVIKEPADPVLEWLVNLDVSSKWSRAKCTCSFC